MWEQKNVAINPYAVITFTNNNVSGTMREKGSMFRTRLG